jgi:hypothetical protein
MSGKTSINKVRGLLTIDFFIESTMKKSVFNVKLMNGPVIGESKRKNNTDGGMFDNRAKSFIKINTWLLGKTPNYPSSLVASKGTIRMKLMAKNPFATDNVSIWRRRNKSPGVITLKSIKFLLHGLTP